MASNSDRRSSSSDRSRRGKGRQAPRRGKGDSQRPERPARTGAGAKIANEKRADRERRLAERRRIGRRRTALLAGVIIIVAVGCGFLYNSDLFPVKQVEIVGAERLTEAHVRELAGVPDDATLLKFPSDEVRQRVESAPWVASATVSRDFPDTMVITVEEREPAALVDLIDEYLLVDAEGYIIEQRSLEETTALVVVRDLEGIDPTPGRQSDSEGLRNALDVLAGLSTELAGKVRAMSVPSIDETALFTRDGVEIYFGSADEIPKKDAVILQILDDQEGKVVFIDVRTPDRPISRGLEP